MAEEEVKKSSEGGSLGMVIFLILGIVLVGERLENKESLPVGSTTTATEAIVSDGGDAGARIASEFGAYDPRVLLTENLQNGGTLVPINNGGTLIPIDRGPLVNFGRGSNVNPSLDLPDAGSPALDTSIFESEAPEFNIERPFFGVGNIEKGKDILMTSKMSVRRNVAGTIIGEQLKRAKGVIKEGPFDAVGLRWWNIDFEDVPDGWVPEGSFSAKTGIYSFIFFWPTFFSFLRWIVIIIVAILVITMLIVKRKKKKSEALREKKKETNLSYKEQKKLDEFEKAPIVNEKWQKVNAYMFSNNHTEWRQAILEADIMLDEMLTKIGYAGQSVGEKLKNVEESDFVTLQKAWEAHKVRNRIAHGGSDQVRLDRREAERVIGLYEEVFKEFFYI